jgi:hypothetical protein
VRLPAFIRNGIAKIRGWRTQLAFRLAPRLADFASRVAVFEASHTLRKGGAISLLLDSTILHHAVTHETAWIDTGTKLWGGKFPVPTGYMARIPVHSSDNESREYQDICYLTGIAALARKGLVNLHTSSELMAEQERHPPARFRTTGYSDFSLLDGLKIESLDGWNFDSLVHRRSRDGPSLAELQRARLDTSVDELYLSLRSILGPKHSQDAWHIRTAETHGQFAFMTMDYKLLKLMHQHERKIKSLNLNTKVLSPSDIADLLKIRTVPPHFFSYTDASYPVRPDICWPGERRRPSKTSKK